MEKVWTEAMRPFREEMPVPPVEETTSHDTPPEAVEEAVKTLPSAPTAFATQVVPEATIKFPVVVARVAMVFILCGMFHVHVPVEDVMVNSLFEVRAEVANAPVNES